MKLYLGRLAMDTIYSYMNWFELSQRQNVPDYIFTDM